MFSIVSFPFLHVILLETLVLKSPIVVVQEVNCNEALGVISIVNDCIFPCKALVLANQVNAKLIAMSTDVKHIHWNGPFHVACHHGRPLMPPRNLAHPPAIRKLISNFSVQFQLSCCSFNRMHLILNFVHTTAHLTSGCF